MIRTTRRTALRLEVLEGKQLMAGAFYHLPIHYTNVPGPHHHGNNTNPNSAFFKMLEDFNHNTHIVTKPFFLSTSNVSTTFNVVYKPLFSANPTNLNVNPDPSPNPTPVVDRPLADTLVTSQSNSNNTTTNTINFDRPANDYIGSHMVINNYTYPSTTSSGAGGTSNTTHSTPVSYDSPFPHFPYK